MIADLKPYPAMKDSGVAWLGEVPVHWEVRRNGQLFAQRYETGFPALPILEVSLRIGVQVRGFASSDRKQVMSDRDKYQRAANGDIAYNMMRMWQGAVGVVPTEGLVSPAYIVAKPLPGTEPRFFVRVFRTDAYKAEIDRYSRGIVKERNRLYWEDFKRMSVLAPPADEQAAIVQFLDHVDRRIRRYIRAKQKLIKLLEEQKQAIIHRAVTRGLDPNVRLKPSGVEWLGEVPEHWEVVPFKQRVGFQEGPGIMAADFRDCGVPLLRISCLRSEVATLDGCNFLDPNVVGRRWSHFAVQEGDYLLSASASTGAVSLATKKVAGAIPYTGIIRLWSASTKSVMPFIVLFMGSTAFQDQINMAKSGVGIEHFGPTHLKRMLIELPPPNEQRAIVQAVRDRTASFARAIMLAIQKISLLREYRTRLIADVVTGKMDVREVATHLPDESGEPEFGAELDATRDAEVVTAAELDAEREEVEA